MESPMPNKPKAIIRAVSKKGERQGFFLFLVGGSDIVQFIVGKEIERIF